MGGAIAPSRRPFGVSTRLYQNQRLGRNHVLEIGRHGFDAIELLAERPHFDYHATPAIADLQQWMAEAGLVLHSIHAPVKRYTEGGRRGLPLNLASSDSSERELAQAETEQALYVARRIPFKVLIVHLGIPRTEQPGWPESSRDAARRSIETLQRLAQPLGVGIALEIIPNELSRSGSLAHFVERVLDATGIGICLDIGHAHLEGDVADVVETVSEHLLAIDLHDNRGRTDDHLIPFEGEIDWPLAMTTIQKVGYDGTFVLELVTRGPAGDTLQRARQARQRLGRFLAH